MISAAAIIIELFADVSSVGMGAVLVQKPSGKQDLINPILRALKKLENI